MLEKEVEKYLKNRVEQIDGLCLKFASPGTRGVPDRIILFKGRVIFVELKRPGVRLRINQKAMMTKFKRQSIDVYVVDSKVTVDIFIQKCLLGEHREV